MFLARACTAFHKFKEADKCLEVLKAVKSTKPAGQSPEPDAVHQS